ncbi:hypothetical protein BDV19DRAFT_394931 [Aspergillus venezuelensis]
MPSTSTGTCHCRFTLPPETEHAHFIHSSQFQEPISYPTHHQHAEHPRPLTPHEPLAHITTRILTLANILTPLLPYSGLSSASLSHETCRFEIWTMAMGMFENPPRYEKLEDPLRAFAAWMPNFVYVALGHFEGVLREVVGRLEGERERVIVNEMEREFRAWERSQVAKDLEKETEEKESEETVEVTATETVEADITDDITRSLEGVQLESFTEILEIMTRANDDLISVESAIRKPWQEESWWTG